MEEMEDWTDLISREDLKREISLDAYVEEELSELTETCSPSAIAEYRKVLEEFVRKLEKYAQAGDCWWEWVKGTQPLRQMGGMAVVRNGTIVWATMTWIS